MTDEEKKELKRLRRLALLDKYGGESGLSKEMTRRTTGNKGNRKYSDAVIKDIKTAKSTMTELSKKYGMSYTQVWNIRTGKQRSKT